MPLHRGFTAIIGANGRGKTNLVEAIGFLATMRSFRGAPTDALVRVGATSAVIRATLWHEQRELLVEIELPSRGRPTVLVNKQRATRASEQLGSVNVTVFSPDDLEVVKGGPSLRRELLDDLLCAVHPKNVVAVDEFQRVLRQRNALLKQCGGRLDEASELTLEVWDQRFAEHGERLAGLRRRLAEELSPRVEQAYERIAGDVASVSLAYERTWTDGLGQALLAARGDDLRRGVSTVGPHRDELHVVLAGMPARTHASQGEQRSIVLALRLASHELVGVATGTTPILVLDDVLSELDDNRSEALLRSLPVGQTIITSASPIPGTVPVDLVVDLDAESGSSPG